MLIKSCDRLGDAEWAVTILKEAIKAVRTVRTLPLSHFCPTPLSLYSLSHPSLIPPLSFSHPYLNPLSLHSVSHPSLSIPYPTRFSLFLILPLFLSLFLSPQGLRVDFSIYQRVFAILVKSPNAAQAAVDMLLNIERAAVVTSRIAARVSTVSYDYPYY